MLKPVKKVAFSYTDSFNNKMKVMSELTFLSKHDVVL